MAYLMLMAVIWFGVMEVKIKLLEKLTEQEYLLTGREADVLNTEYLLYVFIREIDLLGENYKKKLPKSTKNKSAKVKSYKLGLGQGLCERLLNATEKLENPILEKI